MSDVDLLNKEIARLTENLKIQSEIILELRSRLREFDLYFECPDCEWSTEDERVTYCPKCDDVRLKPRPDGCGLCGHYSCICDELVDGE